MMSKDENCIWKYDGVDGDDIWETSCGKTFCTVDGSLEDNQFKFYPYCGGEIKEKKSNGNN